MSDPLCQYEVSATLKGEHIGKTSKKDKMGEERDRLDVFHSGQQGVERFQVVADVTSPGRLFQLATDVKKKRRKRRKGHMHISVGLGTRYSDVCFGLVCRSRWQMDSVYCQQLQSCGGTRKPLLL